MLTRKSANTVGREQKANHALGVFLEAIPWKPPVAGYLPIGSEIGPLSVMENLCAQERAICVPVVVEKYRPLNFVRWTPGIQTKKGAFGVDVPANEDWINPGILIVPMLAFDRTGNRLGYGGGFYDRTIKQIRELRRMIAIGFAFSMQECAKVPSDINDQVLDAVVTEKETILFSPPQKFVCA